MMIKLKDIVKDTYTNASGYSLYTIINHELNSNKEIITLSFEGVSCTSSSFLNSSIGSLIETHGIAVLNRIKPVQVSPTQAELLKKYVSSASKATRKH